MTISTKIKNIIFDILFPPLCLSCNAGLRETEKENKICKICLDSIIINSSFFCPKCQSRLPDNKKTCHKETKFLLAAAANYRNETVKSAVKFLKYNKWKSLLKIIGPFIENYINNLNYDFSGFIVLPIPLHSDRLKERGFNQSELIAEIFCRKTSAAFKTDNLKRIKATKNQAELKNAEERIKNIENCFTLANPAEIKNKNIVLVDDVFTTGSTIGEAAKTLKKAGANKIIAFVFAKT